MAAIVFAAASLAIASPFASAQDASPSPSPAAGGTEPPYYYQAPFETATPVDPNGPIPTLPPQTPTPVPRVLLPPQKVSLLQVCPALHGLRALKQQAQDDDAIAQFDRERAVHGAIALAYFHCAQQLAGQTTPVDIYARDAATLDYAQSFKESLPSKPDDEALQHLSNVVNGLAARTRYADINAKALAIAATVPKPAPTLAPPDPIKCQSSGFTDALQNWENAYSSYASDVDQTNNAGAQRSTIFNQVVYGASEGVEATAQRKMDFEESAISMAIETIREAGMPQTLAQAQSILTSVHDADDYAGSFTASGHRGAAAASDRAQLQQSRLAVDSGVMQLQNIYCRQ